MKAEKVKRRLSVTTLPLMSRPRIHKTTHLSVGALFALDVLLVLAEPVPLDGFLVLPLIVGGCLSPRSIEPGR